MFAPELVGCAPQGLFGLAPHGAPSANFSWGNDGSAHLRGEPMASASDGAHQAARRWSPYEMNGGTALGIAGPDYAVVAADTRLSEGYSILSRDVTKGITLTPACVVATGGCYTDVATLHKVLGARVATYRADHEREMPTPALAQLLSNTLYGRRFFPYYAFNVVAGLDAEGKGAVYTYDAVGSYERVGYAAQGAGQKLIIPLLDNIVGGKNRADRVGAPPPTLAEAVAMAKEAFVTAGERDMYTGDAVEIFAITKDGVAKQRFELKKD